MSLSSDIKEYLCSGEIERKKCCQAAFDEGRGLKMFSSAPSLCANCIREHIAGVFVSRGTITDPVKSYYLAVNTDKLLAESLEGLLKDEGLSPRTSPLKGDTVRLYYKKKQQIEDFLTLIGAGKFTLGLVELDVIKSMSNHQNRLSNAEYANMDRTAMAAAEQLKAIRLLKKRGLLSSLPEELAETARLREENPDMPLLQLCRQFLPPISKSGLNHRLRRIVEEAERLRN